jgi:hypothetical protein
MRLRSWWSRPLEVGAALGRTVMYATSVPEDEWIFRPNPSEVCGMLAADGHENTLGGDTGESCG